MAATPGHERNYHHCVDGVGGWDNNDFNLAYPYPGKDKYDRDIKSPWDEKHKYPQDFYLQCGLYHRERFALGEFYWCWTLHRPGMVWYFQAQPGILLRFLYPYQPQFDALALYQWRHLAIVHAHVIDTNLYYYEDFPGQGH